jgi:nucleoside-diphosphate-sugar epimerase
MIMSTPAHRARIAVAGASGFVGTHLRQHLSDQFDFRALTRSTSVIEAQSVRSGYRVAPV